MKNKNVLVTGGCGFIGKNLCEALISAGANVTALDLPKADWAHLPKKAKRLEIDILDKKALKGIFKDIEIVYHLAARPDLDGKTLNDYRVNFEATKYLIQECATSKSVKRFVFYSTQLVVGLFNETRFMDETEPYRTKTIYGQSKIEGEKVVKQYCAKYSIDYTIIRPTSVYGPWGEEPYKEFFKGIKNKKYFHVGKANNLVSWVYVKNLVDLTILSSISSHAKNKVFFGNDFHPYTMREIVDTTADYYNIQIKTIPSFVMTAAAYGLGIFKLFGIKVPIYPFRLKNIKANYCYDISRSLNIGYSPRYDLKSGINETLSWYEKNNAI